VLEASAKLTCVHTIPFEFPKLPAPYGVLIDKIMENKDRRARILGWEKDGEFVSIAYTQEDGQRVIANYQRFVWRRPPREVLQQVMSALAQGPLRVIGRQGGRR